MTTNRPIYERSRVGAAIIPLINDSFPLKDAIIVTIPGSMQLSRSTALIQDGWEHAIKKMTARNWPFYNGFLYRFERMEIVNNHAVIYASVSNTYKDVVGMRAHSKEKYDYLENNEKPDALSVIAVAESRDSRFFMWWRCSGDWDESFELPGAFVPIAEKSIHDVIVNRMCLELNIDLKEIRNYRILNIVHFPRILEIMTVFYFYIGLDANEVVKRNKQQAIIDIPFTRETLRILCSSEEQESRLAIHGPSHAILSALFNGTLAGAIRFNNWMINTEQPAELETSMK